MSVELLMLAAHGANRASVVEKVSAAVECLGQGGWLTRERSGAIDAFFFVEDGRTRKAELHLIVVARGERGRYGAFDFHEHKRLDKIELNLQNSARFHVEHGVIKYDDPPLGGIWRQDTLTAQVERALKGGFYRRDSLKSPPPGKYSCSSYAEVH